MKANHKQLEDLEETLPNAASQAAEIWMSESIAPPLVYGGEVTNFEFLQIKATEEEPIVLIRYNKACSKLNVDECLPNTIADVRLAKNSSVKEYRFHLTLYGNIDLRVDNNQYQLETKNDWITTVDEVLYKDVVLKSSKENAKDLTPPLQLNRPHLRSVFVHEFGHVIGLHHPFVYDNESVMSASYYFTSHYHLWPTDKACIRAIYGPRNTRYEGEAVTWNGEKVVDTENKMSDSPLASQLITQKATRLSINNITNSTPGVLEKGRNEQLSIVTSTLPGAFPENEKQKYHETLTAVNVLRTPCNDSIKSKCSRHKKTNWSQANVISSDKIGTFFDVNPTYAMYTFDPYYTGALIYHTSDYKFLNKKYDARVIEPPLLNIAFAHHKNTDQDDTLETEKQAGKENNAEDISKLEYIHKPIELFRYDKQNAERVYARSNLPVTVAYDNKTEKFIYAIINTYRDENLADKPVWPKDEGGISIALHNDDPEVLFFNHHDMLHEAYHKVRDKIKYHKDWKPQFKTDFGVALACINQFQAPTHYPFNCFLAWIDRGMPRNRNVLYTWFRIREPLNGK